MCFGNCRRIVSVFLIINDKSVIECKVGVMIFAARKVNVNWLNLIVSRMMAKWWLSHIIVSEARIRRTTITDFAWISDKDEHNTFITLKCYNIIHRIVYRELYLFNKLIKTDWSSIIVLAQSVSIRWIHSSLYMHCRFSEVCLNRTNIFF